jgi:hypothetical protein
MTRPELLILVYSLDRVVCSGGRGGEVFLKKVSLVTDDHDRFGRLERL